MTYSKSLLAGLCGLLIANPMAAKDDEFNVNHILKNIEVYAALLAVSSYYVFQTPPQRESDISFEAFKKSPLAWLRDVIGNRAKNPSVEELKNIEIQDEAGNILIIENQPVWTQQEGRGILGAISRLEDALLLMAVVSTLKQGIDFWDTQADNPAKA